MSNHLAVATVSAALRTVVDGAARAALSDVSLSIDTVPPDKLEPATGGAGISVFLYQATANASWRNDDLPTRRRDGTLARRPQTALDLYYLLTFFGDEKQQHPERLLGSVTSVLHAEPLLDRDRVRQVIAANDHLAGSDLAEQVDLVRFVPVELNLEELSKLWSVFFQTNYRLSAAYRGSVVLIEPDTAPRPSLPVRRRLLYVDTLRRPVVEAVAAAADSAAPIVAGDRLQIRGRNLRGERTLVSIGGQLAEPAPEDLDDSLIGISLSEPPFAAAGLRAGAQGLQVVHERLLGDPETPHRGVESNVMPVVVRPVIRRLPGGAPDIVQGTAPPPPPPDPPPDPPPPPAPPVPTLTVRADPVIGRDQRVLLLLNGAAASYAIPAPRRAADGSEVVFLVGDVAAGDYLVRLVVDGAESTLEPDADGRFAEPGFEVTG